MPSIVDAQVACHCASGIVDQHLVELGEELRLRQREAVGLPPLALEELRTT